jgi:hypothetical protein
MVPGGKTPKFDDSGGTKSRQSLEIGAQSAAIKPVKTVEQALYGP